MFELPTSIFIDGVEHPIRKKGDFRMVLDCFSALSDSELDDSTRVYTCLIIFYDNMTDVESVLNMFGDNLKTAITEMFNFFNCGQDNVGAKMHHALIDWERDQQLIASAVNNVAQREIRIEPYVHWWTFMGYYLAVGESTLTTIVSIRHKIKSGKKLEKHEREFRRNNPQYFVWNSVSTEDAQVTEMIKNLWGNGG